MSIHYRRLAFKDSFELLVTLRQLTEIDTRLLRWLTCQPLAG